jgi:hypothetical protein
MITALLETPSQFASKPCCRCLARWWSCCSAWGCDEWILCSTRNVKRDHGSEPAGLYQLPDPKLSRCEQHGVVVPECMIPRVCGGLRVTSVRLPLPAHLQGPQPWGLGTGCLGTPGAGRHTLSFVRMASKFFFTAHGGLLLSGGSIRPTCQHRMYGERWSQTWELASRRMFATSLRHWLGDCCPTATAPIRFPRSVKLY